MSLPGILGYNGLCRNRSEVMASGKARRRLKALREENLIQLVNSVLLSNIRLEGDGIGQDNHTCDPE